MKQLFFLFTVLLGLPLFSHQNTLFRDEETGFVMEVPAHLRRTWNVSNYENGIEVNVFHSDLDGEEVSFIITGKIPLASVLGEGSESFYPMFLENLKEQMDEIFKEIEVDYRIDSLTSLADESYCAQRYHFSCSDEGEGAFVDLHSFLLDRYAFFVVTAVSYEDGENRNFEKFSEEVLKKVRFIEEGK